jgi:hypothetical protein
MADVGAAVGALGLIESPTELDAAVSVRRKLHCAVHRARCQSDGRERRANPLAAYTALLLLVLRLALLGRSEQQPALPGPPLGRSSRTDPVTVHEYVGLACGQLCRRPVIGAIGPAMADSSKSGPPQGFAHCPVRSCQRRTITSIYFGPSSTSRARRSAPSPGRRIFIRAGL